MATAPPVGDADPWSEETEVSVLGAMLIDDEARTVALERLESGHFYREANARIFAAFARLNGRTDGADVATLADELQSDGELEAVGGMPYLAKLVDAVPNGKRVADHADRLRELRVQRQLRQLAADTMEATANAGPGQSAALVSTLTERLRELEAETVVTGEELLRTAREILEDPDARKRPPVVSDRLFWRGVVSLLAGREKAGKSTLLRWAAARVSRGLRTWRDDPTPADSGRVLYWAEERPVDVAADLERMGADLERVHVRDMRLDPGDRFATLRRDLDRVQPDLLIVDTLATFVDRMDLDPGSSSDWSPVMNRFGALAQENEVGIALNHHARKSDGEYRDSTAIGAGVDAILELRSDPQEGENVRAVTAKARSAVPAHDFEYELVESEDGRRLELLDRSLSLEERVQRFIERHEGCGQRDVIEGVRGGRDEIIETLKELCEPGGPLVEQDDSIPYQYYTRQHLRGNGDGTGEERKKNGGMGNGGESVPNDPGGAVGPPGRGTPAEPVDRE